MAENRSGLPSFLGALVSALGLTLMAGVLVVGVLTPMIFLGGATVNNTVGVFDSIPDLIEIDQQPQQNRIFAVSNGQPVQIATLFNQNREEVAWEAVSDLVKDAAVSGEDRRFYEHGGVDLPGIARAAMRNLAGGRISQGASTITQQYVKNTFIQAALELPDAAAQKAAYEEAIADSFKRKLTEVKLAISLEKRYTKQEILLAYLNIANFGGNTYGIEAAARRYFNTSALDVSAAQAASLIAIVQAPSSLSLEDPANYPANLERRDVILNGMLADGKLTVEQHAEAVATPLDATTVTVVETSNGCMVANDRARYFCDYVTKLVKDLPALGADAEERAAAFKHGGYDFYTTLDMTIQTVSQDAVWANAPNDATALELGASAVTVEVGTGRILAMAQNKVYNNTEQGAGPTATAVNFSTDKAYGGSSGFQPGSTYKVFTLLDWLSTGHGLNEEVDGSPRTIASEKFTDSCGGPWNGPFEFKNDDTTTGRMSVGRATQLSVNGAFVSMALKLDLCDIKDTAESVGVHRADGGVLQSNPSSVLGTNEIAPLTMAAAYAAIAGGGTYCAPIAIDRIVRSDGSELPGQPQNCSAQLNPAVAATAAYAMGKVITSGTATRSNPRDGVEYIAKTGTSDSSNHTWVVGASSRVATAVWVGNIKGFVPIRSYTNTKRVAGGLIRHDIFRSIAMTVDNLANYRGTPFPKPDPLLLSGDGLIVPDVSNISVDAAEIVLETAGFRVRTGAPITSTITGGLVAGTRPAAEETAREDSVVIIYPSKDASTTVMPDVVGDGDVTSAAARSTLADAGFANIAADECSAVPADSRGQVGMVLASVPQSGASAGVGDLVTLQVGHEVC